MRASYRTGAAAGAFLFIGLLSVVLLRLGAHGAADGRITDGMKDYAVRPAPLDSVKVEDEFWSPRLETNRTVSFPHVIKAAAEAGEFDNFAKAAGLMDGPFRGSSPARDSDAYKIIEGIAYTLAARPDPELEKFAVGLIEKIIAAQESDGYIFTARRITPPDKMPEMAGPQRWSRVRTSHEIYVMGLLMEAGAAWFEATGKRNLLDAAVKSADLLEATFGPASGQRQETSGHEEIELALVKLYRATGREGYARLAEFFVEQRGRRTPNFGAYAQDHLPVVEQTEAVGHAVRAGYLYAGVTDLAALTGNSGYVQAMDRIWRNVVDKRMYITGGLGSRGDGEAFGDDYELPNMTAYNETCAAVANVFWQHRLFLLHRDARYIDVLERALYNGVLGGVALSGDRFFYTNALESDGSAGYSARRPWFSWPCCLTNIVRLMPSVPGYIYASADDAVYVNLFVGGAADLKLGEGDAARKVRITQRTRYPWDGGVTITVNPAAAAEFALHVRIPGWTQGRPGPGALYRYVEKTAAGYTLKINGEVVVPPALEKGYAVIVRTWRPGDTVELDLSMPVRRVLAHEGVESARGRFALERGPLVYCAEAVDNGGRARTLALALDEELVAEHRPDLLGGVTVIRTADSRGKNGFTAVPYYAWSNRGDGEMCVWLRIK